MLSQWVGQSRGGPKSGGGPIQHSTISDGDLTISASPDGYLARKVKQAKLSITACFRG